jgi:glutathione synthase/RimK-type ligase-like ATP-grasp enzyme
MAMVKKTAAFRQRRAADTARWRERLHRGAAVYPVEVDGTTFDLMERFGGLEASKAHGRDGPKHPG